MLSRIILFLLALTLGIQAMGKNSVTVEVVDENATGAPELELSTHGLSNMEDCTTIRLGLTSKSAPLQIFKVELRTRNGVYEPIEPFSFSIDSADVNGKKVEYIMSIDFPQLFVFYTDDKVVMSTDRGVFEFRTTREGALERNISLMKTDYESKLEISRKETSNAWTILAVILAAVAVCGALAVWLVKQRFLKKKREMQEMSMLVAERTARNEELRQKVDSLYGSRLDTLNLLCNEYFDRNDSPQMRVTLYNEVEKQILALRDSKSVEALQDMVNTYVDNILVKVTEQLPTLSKADVKFLTYLYAGFSPRAVCIFTDIKIKNFYNRRLRLKERILSSDAPDREWFVSKM